MSVVIPAYNAAEFIAEALASVFAQTYRDFEVILINDGSPDTLELENAIQPWRERLIYLTQENAGPSAARNAGVRHAHGVYVAFLDSDDQWLPEHLSSQMRMFEERPELDLVYADLLLFGDIDPPGKTFMQMCPSAGPVTVDSLISQTCSVPTSCVVVRRGSAIEAGLFDERFVRSEDFDLWVRIAHRGGKMAYQTAVRGKHRLRAGSLASDHAKLGASAIEVLAKIDRTLDLSESTRALIRAMQDELRALDQLERGKRCLSEGDTRAARSHLSEANAFLRRPKLTILLAALRLAPGAVRLAMQARNRLASGRRNGDR
ncbi:MAG: glycosyltransferase family 2 protein [Terriglobia bacterium]